MDVYAGINETNVEGFLSRLQSVKHLSDGIHVDVADGVFVENKTFPLDAIDRLPHIFAEAHLMLGNPLEYVDQCQRLGFGRLIMHHDALKGRDYKEILKIQDHLHTLDMEFCLAFKESEEILLSSEICSFDQILIMAIELGYSGQPFLPKQLDKIYQLRVYCSDVRIEVDGHITDETAPEVIESGANVLVSTSYLTGDIDRKYETLKGLHDGFSAT